jgi:polyisoprenoid-binding protein YceI
MKTHTLTPRTLAVLTALLSLAGTAPAAPLTFDFKDPKGVNNVVFKTDAPLESINGTATGISGTVVFDPQNPGALKGKIVVAADSLHVPNPIMKEHLHGEQWLHVAKYPEITFEAESVRNVQTTGNVTTADVTGRFTLKGVTKTLTVPVKFTYLKDRLKDRFPQLEGDLLVLRAHFTIRRSEFGINPGAGEDKVSDQIELSLSLAGQAPRS